MNQRRASPGTLPGSMPFYMPQVAWWPLMILVALSPFWSKSGAGAWLWLVLLGGWAAWRWPVVFSDSDPLVIAVRWWAWACLLAFLMRALPQIYWGDPWSERHVDFRLLFGAMATCALARRVRLNSAQWFGLCVALALMGLSALFVTDTQGRNTTSNPIPWAVSMTFGACVLLGLGLTWRPIWSILVVASVGLLAFLGGVALSESRGAYGIFIWVSLVFVVALVRIFRRQRCPHVQLKITGAVAAVLASVVALALWQPRLYEAPMVRMQVAVNEAISAITQQSPQTQNTSVGVRLYMWERSVQEIAAHPLWGQGRSERMVLIKSWGVESGSDAVQSLGHVHNEYLQVMLDHGLWGLFSHMLPLLALLAMAWRLRQADTRSAAIGLVGIAVMALVGGLTNVNTAHNYYGVMLSLCAGLALLGAESKVRV